MNAWYEIRVRGEPDPTWQEWFEGMQLEHTAEAETVLRGSVRDQTALYSMLNKLRNLGMELMDVRRVHKPKKKSPG